MARPALLAAVALLVLAAGCQSIPLDPADREDRAVSRLDDSQAALDSAETYRYDGTARFVATDGAREERAEFDLDGAVDVAAQQSRSTMVSEEENRSIYVIGEQVYRECSVIAVSWGVENRTIEGDWVDATPAGLHLELLESGSLRVAGADTVDGREATVLAGRPSTGAVERYVEVTPRRLVGGPVLQQPMVQVWIDNRTALPVKSVLTFEVAEGDTTASAAIRVRYHAYGEPVTVELPDEAREEPWSGSCPG